MKRSVFYFRTRMFLLFFILFTIGNSQLYAQSGLNCEGATQFYENFDGNIGSDLPECWSKIIVADTNYPPTIQVSGNYSYSQPKSVFLYGNGINLNNLETKLVLVTPKISNLNTGTHRLRFRMRHSSSDVYTAVQVVALSSNTPSATMEVIHTISSEEISNTFQEYNVPFNQYTGNGQYIGFRRINGTQATYISIDDVAWEPIPSCVELQSGAISAIASPTSITISWNDTNTIPALGYEYYVSTDGGLPSETNTFSTTTATTVEVNNLVSGQLYNIFVRRICGENDKSIWRNTTVKTPLVTPAPWTEDFEGNNLPEGWVNGDGFQNYMVGVIRGNTGIGDTPANIYKNLYGGSRSVGVFSTITIGPLNSENYELSYHYKQGNYDSPYQPMTDWGNFKVEISTDFGQTWQELAYINNEQGSGEYIKKTHSLSDYYNQYVTFRITANRTHGDFDLSFDKFEVIENGINEQPISVTIEEPTSTTLTTAGAELSLVATVANASNTAVTWTSTDETVATVSADGVVTAVGDGTAVIRATSVEDPTKYAEITVEVSIAASSASFRVESVVLYPNPTVDVVNISTEMEIERVEVYNTLGQKIGETQNKMFDLSGKSNGVYFVKVYVNGAHHTYKIVKK